MLRRAASVASQWHLDAAARRAMASSGPKTATPPPDTARGATADLCDVFYTAPVDQVTVDAKVQIAQPIFRDFGGNSRFSGQVSTGRFRCPLCSVAQRCYLIGHLMPPRPGFKCWPTRSHFPPADARLPLLPALLRAVLCFENNPLVRKALEEQGRGRVLVVDGGGSKRCALLGDNIAAMAVENGWSGIIIHGCLRDSDDISRMALGVKALATHPLKSSKRDPGLRDVPVTFAGVSFKPGDWVYADKDGVLVAGEELKL